MREVAVLGIGMTRFGELWDRSFREIGIEAGLEALVDAKLSSKDLSALYLGSMASGPLLDQEHIAPLILDYAGLSGRHLPAIRVEGGAPRDPSRSTRGTSRSRAASTTTSWSAAPRN
ncbi:acetyl-CoA acetyltransferase [mine drainage metagenome]|uniref:Acetyl-CoA acetyltransferase n=1 Tax=mine drainage metagenome TaxID=410659 RepID=T1BCY0_9ZZZZ